MPNKIDVLARISPQMAAVLAKEDELAGDANDTSAGFAQMRENYVAGRAWWNEGAPEMDRVVDDAVEGSFGAIGVRRYYPCEIAEGATAPAIVYVHGGGFVLGNLDTHDRICRILAKRAGVPVVAVDYRLSPEAKYPSAVREAAAVAAHLHEAGKAWGIDGRPPGLCRRLRRRAPGPGRHAVSARGDGRRRLREVPASVLRVVRPDRLFLHAAPGRSVGRPHRGGLAVLPEPVRRGSRGPCGGALREPVFERPDP